MADILKHFSRLVFLFGVAVLLAVLPFSKYVISVSQFIIAGAWLVGRLDYDLLSNKIGRSRNGTITFMILPWIVVEIIRTVYNGFVSLFRNRPALIFTTVYFLHIAGLLYTTDFDYAFRDLRIKLPLLLLPLLLATAEPVGKTGFRAFLMILVLSLTVATVINTFKIHYFQYADLREVARHVSHIILGLTIVLSLFILLYFIVLDKTLSAGWKAFLLVLFGWQLIYLFLTKSFTGIAVFFLVLPAILLIIAFRAKKMVWKIVILPAVLLITGFIVSYFVVVVRDFHHTRKVDFTSLDSLTPRGNPYTHNPRSTEYENGNPVWIYIQMDEMRASWNQRSIYKYDSLDRKGEIVAFTLIRFLASKDLRRDADGVAALSEEEVRAIERGITNVKSMNPLSIRGRIYELLWGFKRYRETGDPTGLTLMQRLEFWRASAGIISQNFLTGVGTGDPDIAFRDEYVRMKTKLPPEQRWKSHNQFLSVWVVFGLIGFILFLFAIFYPPVRLGAFRDYFFTVFIMIAMLAMMTENTIETQTGVTFFTFFYCFFLFFRKETTPFRER